LKRIIAGKLRKGGRGGNRKSGRGGGALRLQSKAISRERRTPWVSC
jgi:hypothetical protein